jgi:divalent metal cation (Fe/Co/Zn/Cd) transporter
MSVLNSAVRDRLIRTGFALEWVTLSWNVAGVAILGWLAITSSSTALAGFGLDSLIEIGASTVVIWELSGTGDARQRRALRLIGFAFLALAAYLFVQSGIALLTRHHPDGSIGGIAWTAITAACMFTLATLKTRTGTRLGNPVLRTEGHVTFIDGLLAVAVLLGVLLNTNFGWWWADPLAGLVIVYYAIREAVEIFRPAH